MSELLAGDNNRRATPARIITQIPIFRKRSTKFGDILEKTGRFKEIRSIKARPNYSHIMSAREKELRRLLKPRQGTDRCTIPDWQERAKLQAELAILINQPA